MLCFYNIKKKQTKEITICVTLAHYILFFSHLKYVAQITQFMSCSSFYSAILQHPAPSEGLPHFAVLSGEDVVILQDTVEVQDAQSNCSEQAGCDKDVGSPSKPKRSLRLKTKPKN